MTTNWHIRPARPDDAQMFRRIENSAGTLFRTIADLANVAEGEDLPVTRYRELIVRGICWAAEYETTECVGFLCAEPEDVILHIWEIGVDRQHQRQGIGRQLIGTAIGAARLLGMSAVTLTTFRHVPWNAPFYEQLGFVVLSIEDAGARLRALLRDEVASGLPAELRCAMRLDLA